VVGAERPPFVALSIYIFGKPILVFIVTIIEVEISERETPERKKDH